MVQLDVVHAAHESPGYLWCRVAWQSLHNIRSKVDVALLEVEDVIEAGGGTLSSPLAVQRELRTVAVSLQLDGVPGPVTDSPVVESDKTLPATKVESVLELPVDDLQDAVVDQTPGVHDGGRLVPGLETQAEAEVPLK